MKLKLGMTLGALALVSGLAYAAGPGGWGCDGESSGFYGMGGHYGGMGYGERGGMGYGERGGMAYGGHGGMDPDRMVDLLDRRLNLSDEQEAQLFKLISERQAQHGDQREAMWAMMEQGRALDPSDPDYRQQAAELAKRRAALMEGHFAERAQLQADIYALLTPEQQQQFKSLRERGFGRGHGHGHGGWGFGPRGS